MALVSVRDLTFTHGGPPLFNEISFQVESGERIGLVGRNGTGKSTLLKLLCGALQPDDGSIIIGDDGDSWSSANQSTSHLEALVVVAVFAKVRVR